METTRKVDQILNASHKDRGTLGTQVRLGAFSAMALVPSELVPGVEPGELGLEGGRVLLRGPT